MKKDDIVCVCLLRGYPSRIHLFKMVLVKMLLAVLVLAMAVTVGLCDPTTDSSGCPVSFREKCRCGLAYSRYDGFKNKRYTVNCTNTGFASTEMLHDLPENTEVLIFSGNYVPELPANVLDNLKDYGDLEAIDMSNNNIRFIQGKTFHKVYSVTTLVLDHNDLEITDEKERPRIFSNFEGLERLHLTNAFTEMINASDYLLSLEDIFYESKLTELRVLHLEQNEIWSIGKNQKVFCQLPKLEQVLLGDNRLIDFDFRIDCLPELQYIDLERNMIFRLSDEAMTRLDSFSNKKGNTLQINMEENPFSCDCRSKSFIHWLNSTGIDVMHNEVYKCVDGYPTTNIGKKLREVQQLTCPSSASRTSSIKDDVFTERELEDFHKTHYDDHHTTGYSSATIGALSFLLVFTSSLLLAVAYFHRKVLKDLTSPIWTFITRYVGYTGIADEETPREVNV